MGAQVVFPAHQRHADHERDGRQPLHGCELLAEEDKGGHDGDEQFAQAQQRGLQAAHALDAHEQAGARTR